VVNATAVEFSPSVGAPSELRTDYRDLGPLLGGELPGASVYEFDSGERNGRYHEHRALSTTPAAARETATSSRIRP
jgi:hypothetical protein